MLMPSQPVIKQLREDLEKQLGTLSDLEEQRLEIEKNRNRLDRAIDQIAAVTRYLKAKLDMQEAEIEEEVPEVEGAGVE